MSPNNLDKYLYIRNLRTWKVRALYAFGIFSWLLVVLGFIGSIFVDPFYAYIIAPLLAVLTIYHLLSFTLNLWYKQFDLKRHFRKVKRYWRSHYRNTSDVISMSQPWVDIFLPICGEDMEVLRNTWKHVARLEYKNKKVYVLDDSPTDCEEHKALAAKFGFHYFERPNKGEMKKAGNLKYAYKRTQSEFIAIFDADFAPHPDFLLELLPYTADPKVGIVQSPQYFDVSKEAYKKSPLAYAAAYQEEVFYRIMQVAKDRLGAAICCGSNAIYRREALRTIGGPRQVDASEDSRTGFALVSKGWIVRYVPIILALGMCPDNIYTYFHQQHRWCRGRSQLILSREFITSPASLIIKLCNISGFLAFLSRPLVILMSFNLFWVIFFYNEYISFENTYIFYPYMAFALVIVPFIHLARFRFVAFYAGIIQLYASTHALLNIFLGKSVGWVATGAKHTGVSSAFKQAMYAVGAYIALYAILIIVAIVVGLMHLLDFNYYSVQFWIFYNFILSIILFAQMYRVYRGSKFAVASGLSPLQTGA